MQEKKQAFSTHLEQVVNHEPLHTRSMVLTCVPSSMVWIVKSISGRGFFSWMARMALSTCCVVRRSPAGPAAWVSGSIAVRFYRLDFKPKLNNFFYYRPRGKADGSPNKVLSNLCELIDARVCCFAWRWGEGAGKIAGRRISCVGEVLWSGEDDVVVTARVDEKPEGYKKQHTVAIEDCSSKTSVVRKHEENMEVGWRWRCGGAAADTKSSPLTMTTMKGGERLATH